MEKVEVDFGAGPAQLPAWAQVLDLTPGGGLVPPDGPVDWTQLDALPHCLTVEWSGAERGVIEAVATRTGIRYLYWSDAAGEVDLRRTGLVEARLDGAGLRSVYLPESMETLLLTRPPTGLEVQAPGQGRGLDLRLFQYGPDVLVPNGLRRVPKLWLWVGGEFSAAALANLTELRELTLTFDASPGRLTGLSGLCDHQSLHTLQLDDAYGLDPEAWPQLPGLRRLVLNGTRRTIAAALKARFKDGSVRLSVNGAKSEAWLAEHLDNPFRDWVEDSKSFGLAACKAYVRAWRAMVAIAAAVEPQAPDRLRAGREALRDLVADLNAIHDKHGLIDTLYREQVWEVFRELAGSLGISGAEAGEWFDELRRF